MGGNWSETPTELLNLISTRLHSLHDYFNFTYVCKSWQSSSDSAVFPQPPFLVLPHIKTNEEEEEEEDKSSRFLGLAKGGIGDKVYHLDLPEAHDSRCIGSKGTWVAKIDMDLQIHIFNPFSRVQICLPPHSKLVPFHNAKLNNKQLQQVGISKLVLSSTPNDHIHSSRGTCCALVIHHICRYISFARLGDESWTAIQGIRNVDDVIFYNDKWYAITRNEKLLVCDIDPNSLQATTTQILQRAYCSIYYVQKRYLVEWLRELLLVLRYGYNKCNAAEKQPYYENDFFEVYKFDFINTRWEKVENLGRHSLFLGFNNSVSVISSEKSLYKSNCIYFTDDHHLNYYGPNIKVKKTETKAEGGRDMGVFDMKEKVVQPFIDDKISTSLFSPPVWIVPKFTG